MAGKQLRDMLTDLRAEVGHSTNVAHGINDRETLIYYLNRTQIQLYQDYDWPQLVVDRDIPLADGQRFYDYPTDLAFDDINHIWALINTVYCELAYGIGPYEMTVWNSDTGFKSWPPRKWMHHADTNMLELWPVPDLVGSGTPPFMLDDSVLDGPHALGGVAAGWLRLRGTKTVIKMVND